MSDQQLDEVYDFGGVTYTPSLDKDRLGSAIIRVFRLMRDGKFRTLRYIARECSCSEAGASARLRDFRKKKFQQQFPQVKEVISRRLEGGLFAYRLVIDQ